MNFGSLEYLLFFIITLFLFNQFKKQKHRILIIFAASLIFYSFWNWKFCFLLIGTSLLDYFIALLIEKRTNSYFRFGLLFLSLFVNIGVLIFFKYTSFFIYDLFKYSNISFVDRIILPVGISFFTFQTLSYTIDVYLQKIKAERNFINFAAYVSMFPQLVAGPIVRASNLLPQLKNLNRIVVPKDQRKHVLRIITGFFKKLVLADNLAPIANSFFSNFEINTDVNPVIGTGAFMLQIYLDFSAYSDIAIGTAGMFGLKFNENFNYPYHAKNIKDFWKRWHISLTSWFRDYLYIPLGGNRKSISRTSLNIFFVFVISGFWHGAATGFIIWGIVHFILYIPTIFKQHITISFGLLKNNYFFKLFSRPIFLLLILLTWIPFRAHTLTDSINIYSRIFSKSFFTNIVDISNFHIVLFSIIYVAFEPKWDQFVVSKSKNDLEFFILSNLLVLITIAMMANNKTEFIYFQF